MMGLAGVSFVPTLSPWTSGDVVAPLSPNGVGVDEDSMLYGRINPFAAAGMGSASASGLLMSQVVGDTLRFAGSKYNPPASLSWGVAIGQNPLSLATPPSSYSTSLNPTMFRYGFALSPDATSRTLVATAPPEWIISARSRWYTSALGTALNAPITALDILSATITVPAPGVVSLALIAGANAWRRRRRR
ncbi:MAG: hypothetical protein AB7Q00_00940 [Phycisphaerales bacterium]